MKFTRKIVNKILCLTVLGNMCCNPVSAVSNINFCDYRFVNNASIIESIKSCVDFSGPSFKSLWATGRKGESREHLEVDTDHILYTVQLSPTTTATEIPTVNEIYISAPIIDSASGSKIVGDVAVLMQYSKSGVQLSDVIRDFCLAETLPRDLNSVGKRNVQYFLNDPDASTKLPVEYEKIESFSAFEAKEADLEAAKVIVDDKDKKALGTGLSNINKMALVNVIKADEQ